MVLLRRVGCGRNWHLVYGVHCFRGHGLVVLRVVLRRLVLVLGLLPEPIITNYFTLFEHHGAKIKSSLRHDGLIVLKQALQLVLCTGNGFVGTHGRKHERGRKYHFLRLAVVRHIKKVS